MIASQVSLLNNVAYFIPVGGYSHRTVVGDLYRASRLTRVRQREGKGADSI